ncbi:MAG: hypothetical protein HZC46_05300 [Ignavibacterium album]|uniref:hypothetical protein n=1 Tax=Ignavibacterium album TaxID=591197 RepID=UPI0026ED2DD0|nr:hypothetical protein [Ignavibacterium album]MBI5661545.1 hypothetical protein [Ignavibacterium album]
MKKRIRVIACCKKSVSISAALIFLICTLAFSSTAAQDKLSLNTSLTAVGGTLSDGSHSLAYYLYGGIRYQAQEYYLSLSLPLVFNSSGSFTQLGGMYFPEGDGNNFGGSMHNSGGQGSMMNRGLGMSALNIGIGDMYVYGSYTFIKETNDLPSFSADGFVKIPTASPSLNIGTDKFDFNLAVSARKFIGFFFLYIQTGYLFLGNSSADNIENPITFSAGVGSNFGGGNHLLLIEYDSYSTIVTGFASPKQLSLGYTYLINSGLGYTMIGSVGLNNSTSDYTVSAGFNFIL